MARHNYRTVLVIREGETGDGDVIRTILVPDELDTSSFRKRVEELCDYGNQGVDFVDADICNNLKEVEEIFEEMNPPSEYDGNDEDENEDYDDDFDSET